MRKRFRRLQYILDELGLEDDARRYDVESRREVQAALFLLQLKQQKEASGSIDLSTQPGYFFKWYAGPYSSRLDDTHGELVNRMHYESPPNGEYEGEFRGSPLVEFASEIGDDIQAPDSETEDEFDRSLWMRTLAIVAYGRVGGNWSPEKVRREVRDNLGKQWVDYIGNAEEWLKTISLLDEEERDRVPA